VVSALVFLTDARKTGVQEGDDGQLFSRQECPNIDPIGFGKNGESIERRFP